MIIFLSFLVIFLLIVLVLTYWKAINYTNQYNRTKTELRKNKESLFNCRCEIGELRYALEDANREVEKWKKAATKEFICFVGSPHRVESCPYLDELESVKDELESVKSEEIIARQ